MDDVTQAYRTKADGLADMLGTVVSPQDPDRTEERWSGALECAGFEVIGRQWHPRRPHATVTARAA